MVMTNVKESEIVAVSPNTVELGSETTPMLYSNDGENNSNCEHEEGSGGCGLVPSGGIIASGFNLATATLGAGTLALPSAMWGSGYLLGSIVLILVCASTVFSIRLLVQIFEKTGKNTYEGLAENLVGQKFEKLTAFLIVAFCWGITIVYIVAIGDILEKLAQNVNGWPERFKGTWGRHLMTIIFWTVCLLPLSLLKEINSLRYSSVAGITATIFLVIAIVIHEQLDPSAKADTYLEVAKWDGNMIASLPVFIFSYCCQVNAFEVYSEMKPRTPNRMTLATALSMGVCTAIYIGAGVAGVANFGPDTDGNILKNYTPTSSVYIMIAFISITFTLTSAYPLCIFPTRDAIVQLMGYENSYVTPWQTRMLICLVLAFASLLVSIFAPGIKVLFGLLGGICGSSLSFMWPALFTLRTPGYSRESAGTLHYLCVWTLMIVGVLVGILGTVLSVYQQFA